MYSEFIGAELEAHIQILQNTVRSSVSLIDTVADCIDTCFRRGNKLLLCGNGGSAADAQHIAAEFVNRFRFDRRALPAIAFTTDGSVLTCIGNDSGFQNIFSRQVEALGRQGDVLVGISTSGNSANILRALDVAKSLGVTTVGFTGNNGKDSMAQRCDYCLVVPSTDTARIQESHEFVWHLICGIVERRTLDVNRLPPPGTVVE